jgi:azurin
MKIKSIHALFLSILSLASFTSAALAGEDSTRTIAITAGDNMKYSINRIEVHPGEKIRIQLKNEGTLPKEVMAHNWVLLAAGQDAAAYATAALAAKDQDYRPKALANEVLAFIPLVGAHHTDETTFNAPTVPGSYPFLCSFPAHCQVGMRGEVVVKP